jgi:hypothetical protein
MIRDVVGNTVVVEGPGGVWKATQADTMPGVGKVDSIVRWGNRWMVSTSKGLISTQQVVALRSRERVAAADGEARAPSRIGPSPAAEEEAAGSAAVTSPCLAYRVQAGRHENTRNIPKSCHSAKCTSERDRRSQFEHSIASRLCSSPTPCSRHDSRAGR